MANMEEGDKIMENEIQEGKVRISFTGKDSTAFYNPVQEFNRDLTVSILQQFVADRKLVLNEILKSDEDLSRNVGGEAGGDDGPPVKRARKKAKFEHTKPTEKIQILDALSASGLRALRFAKEVEGVDFVVANDFSEAAVAAIRHNAQHNNVQQLVRVSYGDAVDVLMAHRGFEKRFHAIDLDPYGSAANFLDAGVQAVADKGILMVTCTDMATLCGNTPEACFNKYGAISLRHKSCHEMALRILLRAIDSCANRYGRYIKPLVSLSVDFYIRCFVQIDTSPILSKDSVTKLSNVFACATCHSLEFQALIKKCVHNQSVRFQTGHFRSGLIRRFGTNSEESYIEANNGDTKLEAGEISNNGATTTESIKAQNFAECTHCGSKSIHLGGPIYTAPMHDLEFVKRLLERIRATPADQQLGTHERLIGVLTVISEELHDVPLYYEHDQLMTLVRCPVPKLVSIRSAILNGGFRCSISHCNAKALKTDAPMEFLWDICRTWAKSNKVDLEKLAKFPAARNILSKQIQYNINFGTHRLAMPMSRKESLLRFQDNKGKNWGPRCKAKGSITSKSGHFEEKSFAKK